MKIIANGPILWGAKKINAGEVFEADEETAGKFIALKWVKKAEEVAPKKAKKK